MHSRRKISGRGCASRRPANAITFVRACANETTSSPSRRTTLTSQSHAAPLTRMVEPQEPAAADPPTATAAETDAADPDASSNAAAATICAVCFDSTDLVRMPSGTSSPPQRAPWRQPRARAAATPPPRAPSPRRPPSPPRQRRHAWRRRARSGSAGAGASSSTGSPRTPTYSPLAASPSKGPGTPCPCPCLGDRGAERGRQECDRAGQASGGGRTLGAIGHDDLDLVLLSLHDAERVVALVPGSQDAARAITSAGEDTRHLCARAGRDVSRRDWRDS